MKIGEGDDWEIVILKDFAQNGASDIVWETHYRYLRIFIHASEVTVGATVYIEARTPAGEWAAIDQRTFTANGDIILEAEGPYSGLRARVASRVDGKYSVSGFSKPFPH